MSTWLAVAAGGALGCLARHAVNLAAIRALGSATPYATAIVNVLGCAAIGLLAGAAASGRVVLPGAWRSFVFVGVLGGFTTFSSFGLDTLILLQSGRQGLALGNIALQVLLGLGAVFVGYRLVA